MNRENRKKQLTALIVDDELHGRENLRMILEKFCPEIKVTGIASSATEAAALVEELEPEVVFLDINMPVLDGFDFLSGLPQINFSVVFVTAHEDYGISAVKAGAIDYLLKPVDIKELKQTVKKLLERPVKQETAPRQTTHDKIMIPETHGFAVMTVDTMIRIEAEGSYCSIITIDGKRTLVSRTLKDFEDSLPEGMFCRVHRSHLVNLDLIKEYSVIDGGTVVMTDGSRIEVSRRKAAEFLQMIRKRVRSV